MCVCVCKIISMRGSVVKPFVSSKGSGAGNSLFDDRTTGHESSYGDEQGEGGIGFSIMRFVLEH